MTADQAVTRQVAHVTMAADVFHALENLVRGLDRTYWSSWQTTVHFAMELETAREVLARAKAAD